MASLANLQLSAKKDPSLPFLVPIMVSFLAQNCSKKPASERRASEQVFSEIWRPRASASGTLEIFPRASECERSLARPQLARSLALRIFRTLGQITCEQIFSTTGTLQSTTLPQKNLKAFTSCFCRLECFSSLLWFWRLALKILHKQGRQFTMDFGFGN